MGPELVLSQGLAHPSHARTKHKETARWAYVQVEQTSTKRGGDKKHRATRKERDRWVVHEDERKSREGNEKWGWKGTYRVQRMQGTTKHQVQLPSLCQQRVLTTLRAFTQRTVLGLQRLETKTRTHGRHGDTETDGRSVQRRRGLTKNKEKQNKTNRVGGGGGGGVNGNLSG